MGADRVRVVSGEEEQQLVLNAAVLVVAVDFLLTLET